MFHVVWKSVEAELNMSHVAWKSVEAELKMFHVVWKSVEAELNMSHVVWKSVEAELKMFHAVWKSVEAELNMSHVVWKSVEAEPYNFSLYPRAVSWSHELPLFASGTGKMFRPAEHVTNLGERKPQGAEGRQNIPSTRARGMRCMYQRREPPPSALLPLTP
jgi:hypothetical protein